MTAVELEGWRRHFGRYPPAEYLLALLWFTVSRALGGEPGPEHAGYWLEPPALRRRREREEKEARRITLVDVVEAAHRRSRKDPPSTGDT